MAAALPAIAIAATIGSTALSVVSQVQANRAAQAQAEAERRRAAYEAAVARNNALIAERQAEDAIQRGAIEEKQHRQAVRRLIAQQQVQFAGQGIELGFGTPVEVSAGEAAVGELDALTIRSNAEREALGFRTQAFNFRAQSELDLLRAQTPGPPGPGLGIATTVLSGASQAVNQFATFRNAGVIPTTGTIDRGTPPIPRRRPSGLVS